MRNLIGRMVEAEPDLRLAGKAMNGLFALQKLDKLDPDIIILDIEMPEMNGIQFLEERRRRRIDIPVVILSSLAQRGARVTMDALALGACDFIMKPSGSESEDLHVIAEQLTHMIRSYGRQYQNRRQMLRTGRGDGAAPPDEGGAAKSAVTQQRTGAAVERTASRTGDRPSAAEPAAARGAAGSAVHVAEETPVAAPQRAGALEALIAKRAKGRYATEPLEVLAIGISTGGPNALRKVFAGIAADLGIPVLVVQHMPAGFTEEFARSLDRVCPLEVREAHEGDLLRPGRVLIAPGNKHLSVERMPLGVVAHVGEEAAVNGHRPSVDVLFDAVAKVYGPRSMAVIMTGMGRDGAQNLGHIYSSGGITLGQDQATSIVYGMPKVAWEKGFVQLQVPLQEMAETINRLVREFR